jgi:glucose-6-phosphate 1-dehydrogenase
MAQDTQPPKPRKAEPCTLVIFGATGDLTRRKLIPALTSLYCDKLLPESFAVIGFARRDKSDEEFRGELLAGVKEFGRQRGSEAFAAIRDSITYLRSTFEDEAGYAALRERLDQIDRERGATVNRLFYLATPPSAYSGILTNLNACGLSKEDGGYSRVIVEKPFGRDLESARALNEQVATAFEEDQVYRIDHYLGKETVQNILAMRFANGIFEPLWNVHHIDHVQITVAESIGVSGRGAYFEESGIIRDMIQNHLLQLLTLIAMEPPVSLAANAVRDEKVKVLHSIRSLSPEDVAANTVRGRYARAYIEDVEVPDYLEEPGVAPDSTTETFAAIRLEVNNWRWGKTPFFLRSGKRMPKRVTEVAIHFRRPPHRLFPGARRGRNVLLLRIQPDEGISLRFASKVPGPNANVQDVRMDFDYEQAFGEEIADAYQRLLLDAMIGDSTLFARRDEVEEAWRIVDSIVAGWRDLPPPLPYPAGSWGPTEAGDLMHKRRIWRQP